MSKRFTDTEKWKDEWFLELKKDDKLVWQYLLDNCTNAGRWKKSFKHLNFCCEVNLDNERIKKDFDGRLIDKEGYFFIPKFLIFQYPNGLNSQKKALIAVVKELDKYGLREIVNKMFGDEFLSISNQSPIDTQSIQDKEKEKDKEKERTLRPQKYFYFRYKEVFGKDYVASFGKDGTIFKDLSGFIKDDELKLVIDRFFASEDEFIKKSGYTIGVFKSQINKLMANNRTSKLIFKKE